MKLEAVFPSEHSTSFGVEVKRPAGIGLVRS